MSISALKAITMVRPGIEGRGKVGNVKDIEATILRELGFLRRRIGTLGVLKKVPLINRLGIVSTGAALREFIKTIGENIEASGIKQKFIYDHSIIYDPDYKREKILYDPAVDFGAVSVKRLLEQTKIDPREIGGLYVASTTFNSTDPPLADRIVSKLIRDGVVKKEDVEINGNGDSGWSTKTIVEGCTGWVRLVDHIERDMQLKQLQGKKNKYSLGLAVAANSMHIGGNNPHEIIAYGDGAAGGLFIPLKDNSGPFIIGPLRHLISKADLVIHPFKDPRDNKLKGKISRFFSSNYVESKKVAQIIAEQVPQYLDEFLQEEEFQINDVDHIIISQTSKGILDRTIVTLAEKYIERQKLNLNRNNIRDVLKHIIDVYCKGLGLEFEKKKKSILCNYILRIIETNQSEKIYEYLNNDEKALFDYIKLLYDSIYRVYDKHGYTGVASIPMAIAQGVEDKVIELNHPMLWLGSGLGIKVQGVLSVDPSYKKKKPDSDYEISVAPKEVVISAPKKQLLVASE